MYHTDCGYNMFDNGAPLGTKLGKEFEAPGRCMHT